MKQTLTELKMSPSVFNKFLNSPLATGIRMGVEAEVVFHREFNDVNSVRKQYTGLPESIDDISRFFVNAPPELIAAILVDCDVWAQDATIKHDMSGAYIQYFMSILKLGDPLTDRLVKAEMMDTIDDQDEYDEEEIDDLINAYSFLAKRALRNVIETLAFQVEEDRELSYNLDLDRGAVKASVKRRFLLGSNELLWIADTFSSMGDIARRYGLDDYWPRVYKPVCWESGNHEKDLQVMQMKALRFSTYFNKSALVSPTYGGSRPNNTFVFEPDLSITSENPGDCAGAVEIVSPPMPINNAIKFVPKFFDWLHDNNAYTNKSTGFHVGVSLPHVGGKVDYAKLAVFLGDEYVLEQFGRLQNTMCASALKFITNRHISDVSSFAKIVDKLRESVQNGARHIIESNLSRYTSINMKPDYIEFRSAGGDYLSKGVDQIINTMLRYAYAMSIASRPDFAKELYAKKLFKLFRLPDDNLAAIAEILSQLSPTSSYYPPLLKRPLKNINQARDNSTNNGKFEVVAPNGKRVIIAANTDYAAKQKAKSYSPDFNYPPYMVKAILRSDEPDVDLTVI